MPLDLSTNAHRLIAGSPFGSELAAFAEWAAGERYTTFVIEQHLRRLGYILPRVPNASPCARYSERQLEAVFGRERVPLSRFHCFAGTRRLYARFLRVSGRLIEEPPGPHAELLDQYRTFLVDVRGLSRSSQYQHLAVARAFLARGLARGRPLLRATRADVERFVLRCSRTQSRHSMQHTVAYIRAFLRYAHDAGYVAAGLDAIDTPRTYRGELPPRAMPWPSVLRLLHSIDWRSTSGRRDRCILHLIAYYGLRPSEVVGLRRDSIDWQAGVINVHQRKTGSTLVLPLAPQTRRLLRDYLSLDLARRWSSAPELFLRARCPYIPLERTAIGEIFERRMREAGLPSHGKHVYRLRHTLAMRLLSRGVGIKAIGDVLGHRSLYGTSAYLRLDVAMLRDVALDVPGRAGAAGGRHA